MNWSTVKNLLIAMLVAANIFLIYNISVQNRNKSYLDEKEVADAVGILASRGLEVDAEAIPLRRISASVRVSIRLITFPSRRRRCRAHRERPR